MAEIKKPKRRIIDVSHPDSIAPSDTSKAVIVKNHALLKDPMMRDEAATTSDEKPNPETPHKIETKLGTAPTLSSALEAPLAEALKKHDKVEPDTEAPKTEKTDEPAEAPEQPVEPATEIPAEPAKEPVAETNVDKEDQAETKTEAAEAPAAPKTEVPVPESSPKPEADEPKAQSEPETEQPAESAAAPTKAESSLEPTTDSIPKSTEALKGPTVEAENAAAAAAAKREAELQKLVDSKKYVLPINSLEQRRTKRIVLLGLLVSILLAAAWVDIALDAGLIHLTGLHAVTHFFST